FTFKVNDGTVDSNVATVTITVTHVNHAPVAVNDGSNASPIGVTVGGDNVLNVLTNDFDIDNQAQGQVVSSTTFTPAGVSGLPFPNIAAVVNTVNGYRVYVANG